MLLLTRVKEGKGGRRGRTKKDKKKMEGEEIGGLESRERPRTTRKTRHVIFGSRTCYAADLDSSWRSFYSGSAV